MNLLRLTGMFGLAFLFVAGLGCSDSNESADRASDHQVAGQHAKGTPCEGCRGETETASAKRRVIILCTGNSCRSQMAEAFWNKYGGDEWEVVSAGTKPSGKIYPLAVEAMAEKGIDISEQRSKSTREFKGQYFDLIVTVCGNADRNCPYFPGKGKRLHHGFDDPPKAEGSHEDRMKVCRRVRDEIEAQVKAWIEAESM